MLPIDVAARMKSIVIRHRNSGYTTLITPLAEDSKYWYTLETKGKSVTDALSYSKIGVDFMGEKEKKEILKLFFNQIRRTKKWILQN